MKASNWNEQWQRTSHRPESRIHTELVAWRRSSSSSSWVRTYKAKNALRDKTKHFEPMEQKSKIYTNNFWTNITFLFIKLQGFTLHKIFVFYNNRTLDSKIGFDWGNYITSWCLYKVKKKIDSHLFFPKYNQEPNTHTSVSFCLRGHQILRVTLHLSLHTAISLHCLAFPEKVQLWNLSHMQVVYYLLSWQLLYDLPSYVRATFRKTVKPQDKFSKLITGNWCENSPCPTAVTQCAFTGWTL